MATAISKPGIYKDGFWRMIDAGFRHPYPLSIFDFILLGDLVRRMVYAAMEKGIDSPCLFRDPGWLLDFPETLRHQEKRGDE
jgi:hypothetical protein